MFAPWHIPPSLYILMRQLAPERLGSGILRYPNGASTLLFSAEVGNSRVAWRNVFVSKDVNNFPFLPLRETGSKGSGTYAQASETQPPEINSVWQRTLRFRCSAAFWLGATALPVRISNGDEAVSGSGGRFFRAGGGVPGFRRRLRRLPPCGPAGFRGKAPFRRRVCAVPAAAARGRAGSARAGGCWRRGRRGRPPARTGPGRAAAPGRGRGAPAR